MSTKRLERTVLEGGRRNTWERRQTTKEERCETRDWLRKVFIDPEYAEENVEPIRRPETPEFSDVLNPVYRFIESLVGQKWDDARSNIKQKFDMKTLAGWHVVDAHIFGAIHGAGKKETIPLVINDETSYFSYYFIDKNGILRKTKTTSYKKYWLKTPAEWEQIRKELQDIAKWVNGRKIDFDNGILYWYTCHNQKHYTTTVELQYNNYGFRWHSKTPVNDPDRYKLPSGVWVTSFEQWNEPSGGSWKKSSKLDKEEVNYFRSLSFNIKKQIMEF